MTKIVQAQTFDDPQPPFIRAKRQASSVDCKVIQNQLTQVQANITQTQLNIQNTTVTYNTLGTQVTNYRTKLATLTFNTAAYNSTNNLLSIYSKLYNSTANTLTKLNQQLTAFQATQGKLNTDYNTYCGATTTKAPPSNPCGKRETNKRF